MTTPALILLAVLAGACSTVQNAGTAPEPPLSAATAATATPEPTTAQAAPTTDDTPTLVDREPQQWEGAGAFQSEPFDWPGGAWRWTLTTDSTCTFSVWLGDPATGRFPVDFGGFDGPGETGGIVYATDPARRYLDVITGDPSRCPWAFEVEPFDA